MKLQIEVDTREDHIAFDLFDTTTLAVGISHTIPGNAVLTFRGLGKAASPAEPFTLRLELDLEKNASITEAAAWLCGRLDGRATALRIGGVAVVVNPDKVASALGRIPRH